MALRRALALPEAAGPGPVQRSVGWKEFTATLESLEHETNLLLGKRKTLQGELEAAAAVRSQVAPFCGGQLPLQSLAALGRLEVLVGSVPESAWPQVEDSMGNDGVLVRLGRRSARVFLMALALPANRPGFETVLRNAGFQTEALPEPSAATPEALEVDSLRRWTRAEGELAETETALGALAARVDGSTRTGAELLDNEERFLAAQEGFARTQSTVLMSGWLPSNQAQRVEIEVRRATEGRCAWSVGDAPDEVGVEPPILLQHGPWIRPFALLLTPYGLPRYREVEPTLFVALGYLLMFGMMFGDVGHGALLVLAGTIGRVRAGGMEAQLGFRLLQWAGSVSAGFGWIYGSCFGLPAFQAYALWHDPLEGDPLLLVGAALGLGVVTLSLAIGLNILNRVRQRDWLGVVLNPFGATGALFYASAVLGWMVHARILDRLAWVPAWVFMAGTALPVALWCVAGPIEWWWSRRFRDCSMTAEKGSPCPETSATTTARRGTLMGCWVESMVEAFESVLLYLSNTISFVRLAAYALSHAAILSATVLMAEEVRTVPALGGWLAAGVLVGGNLVAFVLEGVIAGVQALRLQYYEFLGKFYSGEGHPFTPFRWDADPSQPTTTPG
jgi:V/A-type H+-transporting ATPase subunit I